VQAPRFIGLYSWLWQLIVDWHTNFEVCIGLPAPYSLLTLTFDLLTLKQVPVGGQRSNFGIYGTLRSRLMGQHLSDAPCDIATLTFGLGGHGTCWLYRSSYSICVPSLKFVGLSVRKI